MLEVKNLRILAKLSVGYSTVIDGLSFVVERGKRVAITGESGSGKTMAALSLIGLLPDNCQAQGVAMLDGTDLLSLGQRELRQLRGRDIVYIPQSGADFLNPSMTVRSHMKETLSRLGYDRSSRKGAMAGLLEKVGFDDAGSILAKYPFQLSGGMAQRVLVALALAAKPKLAIADEPTRGLHRQAAQEFLDLFASAFSESAVAIITHDMGIASQCDGIVEIGSHA